MTSSRAARLGDPARLARSVYPVERGFEILCNYVAELSELGLREAGIEPGIGRRTCGSSSAKA